MKKWLWFFYVFILGFGIVVLSQEVPASSKIILTNSKIVFASNRTGNYQIYTMNTDGTSVSQMSYSDGNIFFPKWSPDGQKIIYDSRPGITIMNADGSNQQLLINNPRVGRPTWSPDGTKISYTESNENTRVTEIWIMNSNGSDKIKVVESNNGLDNDFPTWSPDGTQIAYITLLDYQPRYSTYPVSELKIVKLLDGSQTSLKILSNFGIPDWSWINNKIVFYDLDYADIIRVIDPITLDISTLTDVSPPADPDAEVSRSDENPAWSPDGQFIVFDSQVYPKSDRDIYIMDATGNNIVNLTADSPAEDIMPDWQPIFVEQSTPTPSSTN